MFADGRSSSRSGHLSIGKSVLIRGRVMGIENGRDSKNARRTKKNYAEDILHSLN